MLIIQNPEIASAAALAWREIVYETVQQSIVYAQDTFNLDIQLKAIQNQLVMLSTDRTDLETSLSGFMAVKNVLEAQPETQPVDELTRWQLWTWASHSAQNDPIWVTLLNELPLTGQPADVYLVWLERARSTLEQGLQATQAQIDTLESQRSQAEAEYAVASQGSRGLSANLQLEKISDTLPNPIAVRPIAKMALIGTIIGILAWATLWLVRLTLRKTG